MAPVCKQFVEQLRTVSSIIFEGAGKSSAAIGARVPSNNTHANDAGSG